MSDHGGRVAATVLRAARLVLTLDAEGTVVAATAAGADATSWLDEAGALTLTTGAGPLVLGPPRVAVDADEVEVERSGHGLRAVVRHTVDQAWTVRVVLANESDREQVLTDVRLGWHAAPGTVVTALAGGARAAYAVQRADGDGAVLLGRLRSGSQPGVAPAGLLLGPLVLPPGHRVAVQWRWGVVPDPRGAGAADLPRSTWLDLDQTVVLPGGPDVAVVAPGLAVEVEDDHLEVAAPEPGAYVVELRGARGTSAYPLTWAPDLDDLLDAAAARLLAGPTTPAGTVRLDGPAAGLVLQDVLARRSAGTPDELDDALELAAGELVERLDDPSGPGPGVADPVALAFLAREADRTGSASLVEVATRALLATTRAVPGLGLAGFAVLLARVRSGGAGAPVVAHLAHLLAARGPAAEAGADDAEAGAGLELALLLRPRDAPVPEPALLAGLHRLGAGVGAGLPGRVLPPVAPDRVAYVSTLLGLVDEPTGQRLRGRWGVTAAELARRTAAEARARATEEGGPADAGRRALAWLVLGRPPG